MIFILPIHYAYYFTYKSAKIIYLCESRLIFTLTIYNWAWNICYAYLCFVRPSGERNLTNFV